MSKRNLILPSYEIGGANPEYALEMSKAIEAENASSNATKDHFERVHLARELFVGRDAAGLASPGSCWEAAGDFLAFVNSKAPGGAA